MGIFQWGLPLRRLHLTRVPGTSSERSLGPEEARTLGLDLKQPMRAKAPGALRWTVWGPDPLRCALGSSQLCLPGPRGGLARTSEGSVLVSPGLAGGSCLPKKWPV